MLLIEILCNDFDCISEKKVICEHLKFVSIILPEYLKPWCDFTIDKIIDKFVKLVITIFKTSALIHTKNIISNTHRHSTKAGGVHGPSTILEHSLDLEEWKKDTWGKKIVSKTLLNTNVESYQKIIHATIDKPTE